VHATCHRAKHSTIDVASDLSTLSVRVAAAPRDGMANTAVAELIAEVRWCAWEAAVCGGASVERSALERFSLWCRRVACQELGVSKSSVEVIGGHHARDKTVAVANAPVERVVDRLRALSSTEG
jgi:uncharacterized protein YggU (UPF0235/DUF167 family)